MSTAQSAMLLSVAVSTRLRQAAGKGDILDVRPLVRRIFTESAEWAEAYRLLDLVERLRKGKQWQQSDSNENYGALTVENTHT